jgi:succinate dehydrogenase/fumarate reductase cytochrome b subunit (b558 family)
VDEASLRRLHSLTGVLPVGVFLVLHLGANARALAGEQAFEKTASAIRDVPLFGVVEVFGIVLPLAFHAGYGVKLALQPQSESVRARYGNDGLYAAQRWSGALSFVFIAYHLWEFWAQKLIGRLAPESYYSLLSAHLSSTWAGVPVVAMVYLMGVAASTFHLVSGLFALARSSGFRSSAPRRRLSTALFAALGLGLVIVGFGTTIYFATGLRWAAFGRDGSTPAPWCSVIDRAQHEAVPAPR